MLINISFGEVIIIYLISLSILSKSRIWQGRMETH